MLNKILYSFMASIMLVNISSYATNFIPAIEDENLGEDVSIIRKALVSDKQVFPVDNSSIEGKIIITLKNVKSLDLTLESMPEEFNLTGQVPHGMIEFMLTHKDQCFDNITHAANQALTLNEFIFAGYGNGGKLALLLSALWAEEYKRVTGKTLAENQIKVLTFSTSAVGDTEFNQSVRRLLGERNIIDFCTYFTNPIKCGIPIYVLPEEQLVSSFSSLSKKMIINKGIYFASLILWSEFAQRLTFNLMGSLDERYLTENIRKYIRLYYSMLFLSIGAYKFYKEHQFMPSEGLLLESLRYTQGNYRSDDEASLENIGRPPLLSARRGMGKWMRWIIGI